MGGLAQQLDAVVGPHVAADVAGVSVAVEQGGAIETYTAGRSRPGGDVSVTPTTLFQAASISKAVTAFGALRLVAEGVFGLDDDVNDLLTSWRLPPVDEWQPRVTPRLLLCHGAGLGVHGFDGYPRGSQLPTLTEILDGEPPANTAPVRVELVPGLQWRYSGGGTTILQTLMVDVTGTPFDALMDELVVQPVGMETATFAQPLPDHRHDDAAHGAGAGGEPVEGGWRVHPEMAAAGLWCTPTDLVRFAAAARRAITGAAGALLPPALGAQYITGQPSGGPVGQGYTGWGLGPHVSGQGSGLRFGHTGANHGFLGRLEAWVQGGSVAVMTNSSAGGPVLVEVTAAVADARGWPGYTVSALARDPGSLLERLSGPYRVGDGRRFDVRATDTGLGLAVPGQAEVALTPIGPLVWRVQGFDAEVSFDVGEDESSVSGFTFWQAGFALRVVRDAVDTPDAALRE